MERGDTGLGRDAYGLPRRERDRRGYGPGSYPPDDGYPDSAEEDDAAGPGRPVDAEEDDYGQLLRRPGDMPPRQQRLRQPGRPHPGQPGRFPPGAVPPGAVPPNGVPGHGGMPGNNGMPGGGGPVRLGRRADLRAPAYRTAGTRMAARRTGRCRTAVPRTAARRTAPHRTVPSDGPMPNGGPPNGGPPNGGPRRRAGRQARLPNGRRVPRTRTALTGRRGPARRAGRRAGTTGRVRPSRTRTPTAGAARPRRLAHRRQSHRRQEHRRQEHRCRAAPGLEDRPQVRLTGVRSPTAPQEYLGHLGYQGYLGLHRCASSRPQGRASTLLTAVSGSGHPRGRQGPPPEPPGPVIRQREMAVPEDRPGGPAQPVASIAPDGLEAFARDLRTLRAKADLEYPEMAEVSHYEMKTLAAAAGGLRLPSLPVAVAFVRACGGNIAEWEERWQKLAEKITADAARKRRNDEENAEPLEPAEAPAALEPPALKPAAAQPPDPDGGEVYVITSAKPRQPGW